MWFPRAMILGLSLAMGLGCNPDRRPRPVEYEPGTIRFDSDRTDRENTEQRQRIRSNMDRMVNLLQAKLQEPVILSALRRSNAEMRSMPLFEILERDGRWQRNPGPALADFTDSACNAALRSLQASFKGFAEILVTNVRGTNVCVSGKTTDYYQGDEAWWQDAQRSVAPITGKLEFDESAKTAAVPAYVPVLDSANQERVGVAKALIVQSTQQTGIIQ